MENSLTAYGEENKHLFAVVVLTLHSLSAYIFVPKLVCGYMDSAVRTPANLISNHILIDGILRSPVNLVVRVLGIESLLAEEDGTSILAYYGVNMASTTDGMLPYFHLAMLGRRPLVMSQGTQRSSGWRGPGVHVLD